MSSPVRLQSLAASCLAALSAILGSSAAGGVFGQDAEPAAPANAEATTEALEHVRIFRESKRMVALEVGSTTYGHPSGKGPTVTLVGAVHIGDRSYYQAAQKRLEAHDIVLYESVKPSGAGGTGGETRAERMASTQAAVEFLSDLVAEFRAKHGMLPADLDALRAEWIKTDPRFGQFIDDASTDSWGHPLQLVWDAPAAHAPGEPLAAGSYRIVSFGADGRVGGTGEDADVSHSHEPRSPADAAEGDRIQADLAHALGLEFQLDAVNYAQDNWICSDMAADQIERAMSERGLEFSILEGTLAGSSLPARLAQVLLRVIRIADVFTGGAIGDTIKVLLIEMLGDEQVIQASLGQIDPGFVEVIIEERNREVMDDLDHMLADPGDAESIAIFYGAGHLADLDTRLRDRFGYEPILTDWDRAIAVDLERSAVTQQDVSMIRLMVKRMLRQMR